MTLYNVFGIDSKYNDGRLRAYCFCSTTNRALFVVCSHIHHVVGATHCGELFVLLQHGSWSAGRPDVMYEKIAADTMMDPWLS